MCTECKATFTQRAMLNAHMKKHASTAVTIPPGNQGQIPGNQGQIPGSQGKIPGSQGQLPGKGSITAADVVPFLCASCGHGFRQRSALNSHSAVCSAAAAGGAAKMNGPGQIPGNPSLLPGNSKSLAVPTPENSALLKTATVPIV